MLDVNLCASTMRTCGLHGAELILNQNVSATPEMYANSMSPRRLSVRLLRKNFPGGAVTIAATASLR